MRLVFWGTSSFAVPALRALLGEGFDVVGVVTQPDRAVGRSRSTLVPSAVKGVALAEKLPLFQPETPKDEQFLEQFRALVPDLSIVVSYGHILRESLIALPTRGTINLHASLLPALRGAAPIQGAVRAGLAETGVTVMRMVKELDAGPILLQARTPGRAGRDRGRARGAPVRARRAGARRGAHPDVARPAPRNAAGRFEGDVRAQDSSRDGARELERERRRDRPSRARVRPEAGRIHDASRRRGQVVRRRGHQRAVRERSHARHDRLDRRSRDGRHLRNRRRDDRLRAAGRDVLASLRRSGCTGAASTSESGSARRCSPSPASTPSPTT